MIRHLVLFNLKPELEASDRDWLFGEAQGLVRISSVRSLALGKLLEPREDWYKARMATDYAWALTMEFENEEGLYAYQTDERHLAFAQEIRKRVSLIKVMDFVS